VIVDRRNGLAGLDSSFRAVDNLDTGCAFFSQPSDFREGVAGAAD